MDLNQKAILYSHDAELRIKDDLGDATLSLNGFSFGKTNTISYSNSKNNTGLNFFNSSDDQCRLVLGLGPPPRAYDNEVVYGSLINGFAECGSLEEAHENFHKMEESGIAANLIVLTSLLKAYCKIGSLEGAKAIYERMKDLEGGLDRFRTTPYSNAECDHIVG